MEFTTEIKKATDPIYQKISKVLPEIEWPVHAPYIHKINKLKNSVINITIDFVGLNRLKVIFFICGFLAINEVNAGVVNNITKVN